MSSQGSSGCCRCNLPKPRKPDHTHARTSAIAIALVTLAAAESGCASASADGDALAGDESALASVPVAIAPSAQRTNCDGNNTSSTTVGPFGTCREVMLSRAFDAAEKDGTGKVIKPAKWEAPTRWEAFLTLPLGLPTRDVGQIKVTCRETGDRIVRTPLWGANVTYSVGARAAFGHGMYLVAGDNHCVMQLSRRGAADFDPQLKYSFVLCTVKKSGEMLPAN